MMVAHGQAGIDHDFNAFDASGLVWDTTANAGAGGFVAYVAANYLNYRIAATERGGVNGSGEFYAVEPVGTIRFVLRVRGVDLDHSYSVDKDDFTAANNGAAIANAETDILDAISGSSSSGDGDTPVDHNFGGPDALRILDANGNPVDHAIIRAYVQADYDAGNVTDDPPTSVTGSDGRWLRPVNLDADTYLFTVWNPTTNITDIFRDIEVV